MLRVNLLVPDTIHPQTNKFITGTKLMSMQQMTQMPCIYLYNVLLSVSSVNLTQGGSCNQIQLYAKSYHSQEPAPLYIIFSLHYGDTLLCVFRIHVPACAMHP